MENNLSVIKKLLPILTSANTGVWVCNTATGRLHFKNDFFEALGLAKWGVKFSSLYELLEYIHADDLRAFEQAFVAASTGTTRSVAWRLILEDKRMQLESTLMSCDEGVVACTLNKDPMLQLPHLEKQYKTLINALYPSFIWILDDDFHIVDIIMPDGLKLFHSREQLIGADARNYYSPGVNELFISSIKECLKKNQWKEIEYPIDLLDTRYYYHTRIVPVGDNKVFCLYTNIGDRLRRMDELLAQRRRAEESDKMKSVFIANMSHEIKSPLNAIIKYSEYLAKEETPQKRQEYIDIIYEYNRILLEIISNILELSRIESGMSEFHFDTTDVNALVKETVESYIPALKSEVYFNTYIANSNLKVFTDAERVKQVLSKLISQAVKHTESGSITLKVEENDKYLTFMVADTGCGISEDTLEIIQNRFNKLNLFAQGIGLGLAICKSIIDRLGGSVMLTSKVNEGSVFSFTIPNKTKKEDINVQGFAVNQHKKVLLAESSATDLQFVKDALITKYDVVEITDKEKIINSFIIDNPNLVLLNMEMIAKTDVVKKIRAISTSTPIIVMTTSDFYHDQRWAVENGCTYAIPKPFSANNIEELVTTFIT